MNNRDFYLNNIFEVKINKKFNIIKFLFFQLDEMGEGRVSSAQKMFIWKVKIMKLNIKILLIIKH